MLPSAEATEVARAGRPVARAAARLLAIQARSILGQAEALLTVAEDEESAKVARIAGEATTQLLVATYDGPDKVFACKR